EAPPQGVRGTLNAHLSRIRRVLECAAAAGQDRALLVHRSGGYLLDIDPAQVDVLRSRHLVQQARSPGCVDQQRVAMLREAVGLWRGEPLAGLSGAWVARTRLSWRQQHLDTVVSWAQAELRTGDPAVLIGPLIELTGEHPLAESLAV